MLKKLLSTPCCIALLFGCGKDIESSKEEKKVIDRPALEASSILMKVDYIAEETNKQITKYELVNSGWARIPESPLVKEGSPLTFKTKISFNVAQLSTMNNPQDIICEYLSFRQITQTENPPIDGYNHTFKGCFANIDGMKEIVNYTPGQEFPFDSGNLIILEVSSSDTSGTIQIQSDIEVDWH